jgi:2-dehydropantoate 2-reductase
VRGVDIAIIGGGSVGLLLAAQYKKLGHQVTCYVRKEKQKNKLLKDGLHLLPDGNRLFIQASTLDNIVEHDVYIVCVKQTGLKEVLGQVIDFVPKRKPVMFLQNGMSHIPIAKSLSQPVFIGVLDHGAKRITDNQVEHTGAGAIRVGAIHSKDQHILHAYATQLTDDHFPLLIEDNWELIVKRKLVVNAVINPLTALFDVKNGQIVENPHLVELSKLLCKEACDVLCLDFNYMWSYVQRVAIQTKDNISSMRADLNQQRETEIDAISGYLLSISEKEIPYTKFIYHAIKTSEERRISD